MIKRLFVTLCCALLPVCSAAPSVETQARELYQQGNLAYQQGHYQEAEGYFQKALEMLQQQEKAAPKTGKQPQVSAEPVAQPAPAAARPRTEYTVGIDDVLNITVWQNPDLDRDVIVRPDGMISFPLIGEVQAAGLTITALDKQITQMLTEYVKMPEVSISIKKLGGRKVIVLGEVKTPGVHSVAGANTVLEAIAAAGGFMDTAVASSVILIRGGFEHPQAQRLNLTKALRGDPRLNVTLQTEDIVFVPKKFISNVNFFLNQILEPLSRGFYIAEQLQGN
jgi:polysaccharide biosynthesis/export protein